MKPITRYLDGEIRAYHASSYGPLQIAATYTVETSDEHLSHAVSPALDKAVYTTSHGVVCINQSGLLWRYDYNDEDGHMDENDIDSVSECIFSLDGTYVWVYRGDAMVDRGPDLLVLLDAETGLELARKELDTAGQGALLVLHPDGYLLFDVGEGQDGAKMYRAKLLLSDNGDGTHPRYDIHLNDYGWNDRFLVDVAPDGRSFMTVDHGRADVAFHDFDGGVRLRFPVEMFGYDYFGDDEACIGWNGGFLDDDVAVVVVVGERDGKEWYCRHTVDLQLGKPGGHFGTGSRDQEDLLLLGDGSWVVSGSDGGVVRRSREVEEGER